MITHEKHEIFEIEVLDLLKKQRLLEPLVFGGGTMLRLCYELDRYSADLDFWIIKEIKATQYIEKFRSVLKSAYELTDDQEKHYTYIFEIRTGKYPKRLKIEIRRELKECDFQDRIAFSKFSNKQVIIRTHTLGQTMKNKLEALLGRHEIRDAFDIEFLLRKGIAIPDLLPDQKPAILDKIASFTEKDFKVKLGSILEGEKRKFYIMNRFTFLQERLSAS